jgi:hypothetical protein
VWRELFSLCTSGRVYFPVFVTIMEETRKLRKWKIMARVGIGLSGKEILDCVKDWQYVTDLSDSDLCCVQKL